MRPSAAKIIHKKIRKKKLGRHTAAAPHGVDVFCSGFIWEEKDKQLNLCHLKNR
jgi:hypothetical protein